MYDTVTLAFSSTTALLSRGYISCGSISNTLSIFAFGLGNSGVTNTVDIYNYTSTSWYTTSTSTSRYAASGISYSPMFYVAGGCTSSNVGLSIFNIFNADTLVWTSSSISIARCFGAATNVGATLFFGGGSSNGILYNRVDIYDSNINSWSTTSISTSRHQLAAASLGCKAIFAGGSGYSNVDVYDVSLKTWATISALAQGVSNLFGLTIGSFVIFAGGDNLNIANFYSLSCSLTGINPFLYF